MKPIFDCELSADTFDNLKKSCDDKFNKQAFYDFLKEKGKLVSVGGIVIDFQTKEWTNIENLDYETDNFYWNTSDIYHFEKYNLKLNDDFIEYVLNRR